MADIEALMEMPWAKRAMDSNTPTLNIDEQEATVRTMSSEHNGKEILFPTIRMVDGELKRFDEKTAKEIAIEKNDYVEYDNPEQATEASKELSYFIGFARDPEGTMEREEKEYLERMKNLPKGGLMEFIYGFREKGKAGSEPKSKSQIKGGDLRNLISEYGIMPGATPLFTKSVKSETGRPLVRPDEKKGALSQINWSSITWDNLKNIYGEITKETEIR